MWFYLGIDLGSEAITTWVYGTSKEGIILDFYRQMVRNYAEWGLPLPDEIECESNLNAAYREGFLKSGNMFQNVRIEANSARSKRCEGTGGRFATRWKRSIRDGSPVLSLGTSPIR